MSLHKEIKFEVEICEYLNAHGWLYADGDAIGYLGLFRLSILCLSMPDVERNLLYREKIREYELRD